MGSSCGIKTLAAHTHAVLAPTRQTRCQTRVTYSVYTAGSASSSSAETLLAREAGLRDPLSSTSHWIKMKARRWGGDHGAVPGLGAPRSGQPPWSLSLASGT